ncbi:MAG: hypothetical protein AABZ39_15670 [Spirochaetota bacterium]
MAEQQPHPLKEIKVNMASLYREETFSDLGVATIRVMTPVKPDGTKDAARAVLYTGQASIVTEMGQLPLSFALEAASVEDAFKKFPDGMKKAFDEMMQEIREMRREQQNRIVVPRGGMPDMPPAGGKIQLR